VEEGQDFTSNLNSKSLEVIADAKVKPGLAQPALEARYQFATRLFLRGSIIVGLKKLGLDPMKIGYVVITHSHGGPRSAEPNCCRI
jgi:glyoxylase-like metal-dependent hydrolase (beta-lactamase superfamily II)